LNALEATVETTNPPGTNNSDVLTSQYLWNIPVRSTT